MSSNTGKIKVVWLCYFTNSDIQEKLKPFRKVDEIAPWISNLIPLFENDKDIELHIISQHRWIPWHKSFIKNGITYHFINKGIPLIGRHWPGFFRFDILTNDFLFKRKVARIIKKINPDTIHLHGAENEFSSSIMQFHNKYPVFITIQGFINKSSVKNSIVEKKKQNELKIIRLFKYFGVRTKTMAEDVKLINPNAILHWHPYRMKPVKLFNVEKEYDLVFFARISKDKGIEDLLKAIVILKKHRPKISTCVIGGGNYVQFKQMANELGIASNVNWAGFLLTQEDVHKIASTARISVLPTYYDIISGTILESMLLKLPVVAYDVGSIHEVNEKEEIISLVDKLDVESLAKAIEYLLDNPDVREERAEKGYQRANEMFAHPDEEIREGLRQAYMKTIKAFKR